MRKTVTLDGGVLARWFADPRGFSLHLPVILDGWFPPLTVDQIAQNSLATLNGEPEPHPDPNWVTIVVTRPAPVGAVSDG